MDKAEFIKRRGIVAYEKTLQRKRRWWEENPEKAKIKSNETHRKGGKYYEQHRQYQMNGIPHEKGLIRHKHQDLYRPFKQIIAPTSQLHHEWIPGTLNYRGVALVEAVQHQYGIIDPIVILEGEITLLAEAEIKEV